MVCKIVSQLLDRIVSLTWAVSPAQNNPFLLAQIVRRTGTVRQAGVETNMTHTKCVNEEVVLNLVHIPLSGSVPWRRGEFCGIVQKIHFLTDLTAAVKSPQYRMSSGGKISEMIGGIWGEMSPVCCVIILSLSSQLVICYEKVIDIVSFIGECGLASGTEQLVGLPIEASALDPDCIFRSLDHAHKFPKYQGGI